MTTRQRFSWIHRFQAQPGPVSSSHLPCRLRGSDFHLMTLAEQKQLVLQGRHVRVQIRQYSLFKAYPGNISKLHTTENQPYPRQVLSAVNCFHQKVVEDYFRLGCLEQTNEGLA